MKVFLSWSGERSRQVASLLKDWLRCVIQNSDPWLSSTDIDRGALWFSEVSQQLGETTVGILCLTQENKEKPWILFEAGALAKGLNSSRVCTLLIDLDDRDVSNPLSQFNHTTPNKTGIFQLVQTLNISMGPQRLDESVLTRVFDTYWPQFEDAFSKIIESTPATKVKPRPQDDILGEILEATRSISTRVRQIEQSSDRQRLGEQMTMDQWNKHLTSITGSEKSRRDQDEYVRKLSVGDGFITYVGKNGQIMMRKKDESDPL